MFVTYFDEVKPDPACGQHQYVIGGICVPITAISTLEREVDHLSLHVFGTSLRSEATEFHASRLYSGDKHFKSVDLVARIQILTSLAQIICRTPDIRRIRVGIDIRDLQTPMRAAEFAFAEFLMETQLLVGTNAPTLIIGDLDEEKKTSMIRDFFEFREMVASSSLGIDIPSNFIDCVHFAHSHHSRLIQLADAYLFLSMHHLGLRKGRMAAPLAAALSNFNLTPRNTVPGQQQSA